MSFVHLHNYTEYSMLQGATKVSDMAQRAAELGMSAIAITDRAVMCGVPELEDACAAVEKKTGARVKPIFGCEILFTDEVNKADARPTKIYQMVLLAKTNEGYHNLMRLVSEAQIDLAQNMPLVTFDMLKKYATGIIALSGGLEGLVPRLADVGNIESATQWAARFSEVFGADDFYIELQDQGLVTKNGHSQKELNAVLADIAHRLQLKVVATNSFHYLRKEDASAQDLILCIGSGVLRDDPNRPRLENDQVYMKSESEMKALFSDFPEACENTVEIAEKCNVTLSRDSILPRFPLPEGETEESLFRKNCLIGLKERYGDPIPEEVMARYEHEADVIVKQGFPAYFLIVQEYIACALRQGIGVGPGRGSAAGAIVAYALGITDLDPLANGLLFERFLSEERIEMPDIDVDFDDERRDEVIDHVREVYGADHIAGVITFGKLQAKNAVRDAARVLGHPYKKGDDICKLIGNELGITITKALDTNEDLAQLYRTDTDAREIIDAALSVEGNIRNEGVHACATIICRDPLVEHVPVKRDTKGEGMITQFDGHYTPELGLLKMDFLGLRTLTVLSRACRNVNERYGLQLVPDKLPLDDEKAFSLMCGELGLSMDGLFQVESNLYVTLFARMKPRAFSDIVASIALNRPGPLENGFVDLYVNRRTGAEQVSYYDDRLRNLLEETYGTIVYQEQIMQISMQMSGFSAGKADRLRKAMGKKKLDVMQALREDWCTGAVGNGFSLEIAEKIWGDAEEFAKYAFNKSHSAAYAVLVMRTAYLKAHYPKEFMAAVLSSYMGTADKLIKYISSCTRDGIEVLPPDVNTSNLEFTPLDDGIRFGLAGIRGVGTGVSEAIIEERNKNGKYTSLQNFVSRLDSKCYNRKVLESLIKSGAFDSTGYTRKQLMYFVDETSLLEDASAKQREKDKGAMSLFDMFDVGKVEDPEPDGIEWDKRRLLNFEKEILKIYVSDHPVRPYIDSFRKMHAISLDKLSESGPIPKGVFAGLITELRLRRTQQGKRMATFLLEDSTGYVECVWFEPYKPKEGTENYEQKLHNWENVLRKHMDALADDAIVRIEGSFEVNDRGRQVRVKHIERIDEDSLKAHPDHIVLTLQAHEFTPIATQKLISIL